MNENEIARIAAAMNHLRPDWPIKQLQTLLADERIVTRPRRDAAVALTWIACDSTTASPYRVLESGPWWKATAAEGGEDRRWSPPKDHQACGKHPGEWRDRCRCCRADELAGHEDETPLVVGSAAHALAEARALLASKRASLCRHGAATCHECDKAKTDPTHPRTDRAHERPADVGEEDA